jgi:isopenicillin N synthase-like dioxygenase
LITLVKASCDGLVIFPDGIPRNVELADDEIILFAGSLLTTLSDGRIPYMDHAVLSPPQNQLRTSLVYFALPELNRIYKTFKAGKYIDLGVLANELHASFGNRPFADSRVRDGRRIDD